MRRRLACAWLCVAALASVSCSSSHEADEDRGEHGGEAGEGGKSGGAGTRAGSSGKANSGSGTGSRAGAGGAAAAGTAGSDKGASGRGGSASGGSALAGSGGTGGATGGTAASDSGGEAGAAPVHGQCVAPCELALGPADNLPGDSAVVVYDFDSGTATVTSDPAVNAASEWVIGFSYETEPEQGYGSWSTGGWWFAFTEPPAGVDGTYGMQQYVEITSQMVNPTTDQMLRVVYSFGDRTVRVHSVTVPDCDSATSGACASTADCELVEAGALRAAAASCSGSCGGAAECVPGCVAEAESVSLGCSGCYADFLACVTAACPTECPGMGGSTCMSCETSAGCHTEFMACSGLDHMPRGTLTWPLPQPVR